MILPILTYPHQILRNVCLEIPEVTDEIRSLANSLVETMRHADGVGLAAPQVGRSIRLIIVTDGYDTCLALVNPKIKRKPFFHDVMEEGCLSIPNVTVRVKRSKTIKVEYTDLQNRKQKLVAKGLLARVIQHEVDHLEGVLIIDKVDT